MDFFDKLGKKASETCKGAAEKTSKLAKEAKIRMAINDNKSKIEELYVKIGKKVYERHIREQNINIKEELLEECSKIDILSDEIKDYKSELLNLKDKKECANCHSEIETFSKFCSNCGSKQEELEEKPEEEPKVKEVEILKKEDSSKE